MFPVGIHLGQGAAQVRQETPQVAHRIDRVDQCLEFLPGHFQVPQLQGSVVESHWAERLAHYDRWRRRISVILTDLYP